MKFFTLLFTMMFSSLAHASFFVYEGHLKDDNDIAISGAQSFRFVISVNSCQLYIETQTVNVDSDGSFAVLVGDGNRVDSTGNTTEQIFAATGNVNCYGSSSTTLSSYQNRTMEVYVNNTALAPSVALSAVPVAQVALQAEKAKEATTLNGHAAGDFVLGADIPGLVSGNETDPSVQAFAKSAVSGVSGNSCPAGYILTLDNNTLKCVLDGGSSATYTLPVATDAILGGVMVPSASKIAVDASGNLTLKALATSDIAGLDTALTGAVKYTDMPPAPGCAAGEALTWSSPSNTFTCYAITVDQSQVMNLTTDLAGKVSKSGDTMAGVLNMGSYDVLATGHITMSSQKTITVGKYDQNQENTLAGTLTGANEGATWYNSATKALRFWDGSARQTVVSTTAACADGQVLKWNDTTKVWYCAADAGAAGGANATQIQSVDVAATAPTTAGQVLRYDGTSKWGPSLLQAGDLPSGIARSKVAAGTPDHVLINDGSGNLSSEAHLAVTRGGTGQSTYNSGELLIGKSDGTLAKANITAGSGVTVTNGDGSITIAAIATTPGDAGYGSGNKGIVAFAADADTSGISVTGGVATVNTGITANKIVKLDGSAKLPAVDGSALTHLDVSHVDSAAGKWFTYKPDGNQCSAGSVLKWDDTNQRWICGADAGAGGADASTIRGVTVAVSAAAPAAGAFLMYNNLTTSWEATTFTDCVGTGKTINYNVSTNTWNCVDIAVSSAMIIDGTIGNADISATAAIARTKLAAGTADRAVITDSSGFMKESAVTATEMGYLSGVTSPLQTQIDSISSSGTGKVSKTGDAMTGDLTMNAQKEVRFADADSDHYVALRSPATVATNVTLTLPATAGTADYVLKTDGAGQLSWGALPSAASDSNYNTKGVVGFDTNAATSGMVYSSSGIAKVNTGVGADQIVKLDGSAKLPAVDGSALTNVSVKIDKVISATTKYFDYSPNGSPCADGDVLKKTANGWECGTDNTGGAPAEATYSSKGVVQFETNASTSGISLTSGVAKVNTGTTANSIVQLDSSAKLPAVNASNLTDLRADNITSGTLSVARGGTGQTSFTPNSLLIADASGGAIVPLTCATGQSLYWNTGGYWTCGKDLIVAGTSSAVNYVKVTGGVTSVSPTIEAAGSDTNLNLMVAAKGTGKILFNSASQFSGIAYHNNNILLNARKELQFYDSDSSNFVGFRAADDLTSNQVWTLPTGDGGVNSVLTTDGSGTLSWASPTMSASGFGSQTAKTFLAAPTASSGTTSFRTIASTDLPTSGVTPSTYKSVTVDIYGRITNGTNPTTLLGYGITDAVQALTGVTSMQSGLDAGKPTAGTVGRIYFATDVQKIYRDSGSTWDVMAQAYGGLPGGAAGGVLSGTYPNPTLANAAVKTPALFANPGINRLVATDSSTGANLAAMDCATIGYIMTWTATGWMCQAAPIQPWAINGVNVSFTSGFVGVGTSSPDAPVHAIAAGATANYPVGKFINTSNGARVLVSGTSATDVALARNNSVRWGLLMDASAESGSNAGSNFNIVRYDDAGTMIGFGLNINRANGAVGLAGSNADAAGTNKLTVNGAAIATAWNLTSDARLKSNIKEIENPLEKILKLRGVMFDWDKEKAKDRYQYEHDFGVIAQEVEAQFPQAVTTGGDGYRSVNYSKLVAPLIGATHELYGMCKANEVRVTQLEEENAAMKRDIASIKEKAAQLEADNAALKKDLEEIKRKLGL